jgi:copper chaperone
MQEQFDVRGMTCNHCVRAVTDAIRIVDATARVEVDLATGRVTVGSVAPRDRLEQAIRGEGYEVAAAG